MAQAEAALSAPQPPAAAQDALLAAARADDRAGIQAAIANGADPAAADSRALRVAAEAGALNAVMLLIERGADPSADGHAAFRAAVAARHYPVQKHLHESGHQPDLLAPERRAEIAAMRAELDAAPEIYRPSRFWETFGDANVSWLSWAGLENFKRTINQNYFNFVIRGFRDPRIRRSLALWRRGDMLAPLRTALADPDDDPALWFSMDPRYRIFPGERADARRLKRLLYRLMVGAQWGYAERRPSGAWLQGMQEPALGNPIPLTLRGRPVSQDLVNSACEAADLEAAMAAAGRPLPQDAAAAPPVVAELGAGYGRLGWLLLSKRRLRYMIFDIPPTLMVAQWYLSRLFPDRKVFRFRHFDSFAQIEAELAEAEIAFFSANQLELMPDGMIDAFVSISALHEMTRPQIAHYLSLMGAKTRSAVYLKLQRIYRNPFDEMVLERDAYAMPPGWRLWREADDPLNPGFFTLSLLRETP
ncbi:putative sugar O-methyltransferase [Marinibaculum pumilum]|uniref:Sugar O-methyltransferase n=1 Tax=Marinibaculum pumilum TaxID=1766165 RepID=A0ABV7KYF9_9PROT